MADSFLPFYGTYKIQRCYKATRYFQFARYENLQLFSLVIRELEIALTVRCKDLIKELAWEIESINYRITSIMRMFRTEA